MRVFNYLFYFSILSFPIIGSAIQIINPDQPTEVLKKLLTSYDRSESFKCKVDYTYKIDGKIIEINKGELYFQNGDIFLFFDDLHIVRAEEYSLVLDKQDRTIQYGQQARSDNQFFYDLNRIDTLLKNKNYQFSIPNSGTLIIKPVNCKYDWIKIKYNLNYRIEELTFLINIEQKLFSQDNIPEESLTVNYMNYEKLSPSSFKHISDYVVKNKKGKIIPGNKYSLYSIMD